MITAIIAIACWVIIAVILNKNFVDLLLLSKMWSVWLKLHQLCIGKVLRNDDQCERSERSIFRCQVDRVNCPMQVYGSGRVPDHRLKRSCFCPNVKIFSCYDKMEANSWGGRFMLISILRQAPFPLQRQSENQRHNCLSTSFALKNGMGDDQGVLLNELPPPPPHV